MPYGKIITLRSLKGAKQKCEFVRENSDDTNFKSLLYYALNPLLTYNISEKTMSRILKEDIGENNQKLVFFDDIFQCCELLSRLRAMDDATLRQVQLFLLRFCNEEARSIYAKLLTKTLRLGITAKTINKIIPELIPEWEVQQAFPIDKYPIPEGTEFWITQKLNGARATFYKGQLLARSGLPYKGLEHITQKLDSIQKSGYVVDGELILTHDGSMSDNEAFRTATGIINSDNGDKTAICYTLFDIIPERDFESDNPQVNYAQRRNALDSLIGQFDKESPIKILPVLYHGKDQSQIEPLFSKMVEEDKEGLVLNLDVPYKRTRHKGILKVKRFYTMDLLVVGYEEGSGRLSGSLGSLVLDYKGNKVNVGSGFSDEQRAELLEKRDDLTGMLCEVKYKEISQDKNTGLDSLQFPVFVSLRTDKADISYG